MVVIQRLYGGKNAIKISRILGKNRESHYLL
nr:MAG TPA: hypothetical protein [Caudoviricetes sp.]